MKLFLPIFLVSTLLLAGISRAEEKPAEEAKLYKITLKNGAEPNPEPVQELLESPPRNGENAALDLPETADDNPVEQPDTSHIPQSDILSLEQVLIATYETNPDLKKAVADLETTNELRPQALSDWLPSADIDLGYGKKRSQAGNAARRTGNVNSKLLTIDQPLFNGVFSAKFDEADNLIQAARHNFRMIEQEILLSVISSYMDLITDNQIQFLSSNKVKVLARQLEETDARFNVGELTKTDVSQSRARLAGAIAEEARANSRLAASKAGFERISGIRPVALKVPKELPPIPPSFDKALADAEKNNPLLNYMRYYEKAAEDRIDVNSGELLPKLSLRGQMSREESSGITGQDYENDSAVLNVNIPLYQGGGEYSRIREAKKQASSASFNRIAAHNQVRELTSSAWEDIRAAKINIRASAAAVKAAKIALEGVRAEEEQGLRTIIDVLDAEQELFTAKTSLLTAKRDQMVAYYTLLDRIGGLTARNLALDTEIYDEDKALDKVKYKFIGF